MAKPAIVFVCADCGAETLKWQGQCPQCSQWNTLEQRAVVRRPAGPASPASQASPLADFAADELPRLETGMAELDRVLGGGLIPGSVTLLGGEPGIGKSTLVLQLASLWPEAVLYVSAEESQSQVKSRAARLGGQQPNVWIASETSLRGVVDAIDRVAPSLVIIDSIQTIADE